MPSFADNIVLAVLALLLFGPKKLPVLARELGKWIGEFRRASNEFKMQMEEELRVSEQADRQKKVAEMEAAAPKPPALEASTETPLPAPGLDSSIETPDSFPADARISIADDPAANPATPEPVASTPIPIATSGDLNMMPPSTGLPIAQTRSNPIESLIESIPEVNSESSSEASAPPSLEPSTETAAHGH